MPNVGRWFFEEFLLQQMTLTFTKRQNPVASQPAPTEPLLLSLTQQPISAAVLDELAAIKKRNKKHKDVLPVFIGRPPVDSPSVQIARVMNGQRPALWEPEKWAAESTVNGKPKRT